MTIFRSFRRLLDALENIGDRLRAVSVSLLEVIRLQQELGPARERLEKLELSRARFEAECEGKLLQADGKLKAAANAEARERQLKKSYERIVDERDPDVEAGEEGTVLPLDAQAREEERVQALRLVVAPNGKAAAVRAKFGL